MDDVQVTEADRKAAADLINTFPLSLGWADRDDLPTQLVQAFARHRLERSEPVGWMYKCDVLGRTLLVEERLEERFRKAYETETPLYTTPPEPVAEIERLRDALWTPGEKAWAGLARDLMMAFDMGCRTPRKIFQHLDRCGKTIPQWLRDEGEMKHLDHVPSKGTRAMIIYRAMLEPALAALGDAS